MVVLMHWRYRVFFGLMILYMIAACVVACALLWNITVTEYPSEIVNDYKENENLVVPCAIEKSLETDPALQCSLLDRLIYEKFIANGWTKIVHRAKLDNGSHIAVKSVNMKGKDITDCAKTEPVLLCHNKAVDKLVREINLLKELKHETIIRLEYYCSKTVGDPSCMKYAVIGTEIGETLTNLRLLQLTWKERKQVIQDLATLIHYTQNSPLGALGLADLRRPQFVLVKGRLKLADLDDIIVGEPSCVYSKDCSNLNVTIQCISGSCEGYNAKLNIQKSFKEFGPYIFIPEGVPQDRKMSLEKLRHLWRENSGITEHLVLAAMSL